jgi:dolichol-phosphate mannosyltransferase
VHYNSKKRAGNFDQALESIEGNEQRLDEKILHIRTEGPFASGVIKGIDSTEGKYILVMDADVSFSRDIIPKLISELIANPNSIIIASRFVKDASLRQLSIVQNAISKTARLIALHGLKIRNVKDPMSSCFAVSRHVIKDIEIEGKGKEVLLEILVKAYSHGEKKIAVKELPIKQDEPVITRKLDFGRVSTYAKDVWLLYRYGKKSKPKFDGNYSAQKIRKSILFLSKAGRFFTVGASGLALNYLASFLFSGLVPNIWYMHATLFGIVVSITSNFLLNKVWTFEDRDFSSRHLLKQYFLFLSLCSIGALIQLSLVFVFVEFAHIPYAISLIIAVCIASIGNFLLNKKITFGEKIWE